LDPDSTGCLDPDPGARKKRKRKNITFIIIFKKLIISFLVRYRTVRVLARELTEPEPDQHLVAAPAPPK
jgi:hypothetical protein